jgi:hypothetical protein
MISIVRRIAVFAVFALLAAGCTSADGQDSSFTPTSTYTPPSYSVPPTTTAPSSPLPATTGPNVRPGEKPPTLPDVGNTNTPAGARAFAVFYVEALDWGYATMDSTLARSLFAKSCTGCARFVANFFDHERNLGRHYVGSRAQPTRAESVHNNRHDGATQSVDVTLTQQKGKLVDAAGRVVVREPAVARAVFRGWLAWRDGRWQIVDWKRVVFK